LGASWPEETAARVPAIAVVTPQYGGQSPHGGGIGTFTRRLARYLVDRGWTVEVFLVPLLSPFERDETVLDSAWTVRHVASTAAGAEEGLVDWPGEPVEASERARLERRRAQQATARLAGSLSKFDVLHASNYGALLLQCADRPLPPVVCRLSSIPSWWNPGREGVDEVEAEEAAVIAGSRLCYAPSRLIAAGATQHYHRPVLHFLPPATGLPSAVLEDGGRRLEPGDRRHVVVAGLLSERKGSDVALQVAAEMRHPEDRPVVFHFCGPQPPDGSPWRERLLAENVVHHSELRGREYEQLLARADALLVPSRVDNTPNVALEALSCRTPVVAVGGCGCDDLVDDGENGVLAGSHAVADVTAALERAFALKPVDPSAVLSRCEDGGARLERRLRELVGARTDGGS
jgi:glycosyltransferase involved in cell wall biosynthesis